MAGQPSKGAAATRHPTRERHGMGRKPTNPERGRSMAVGQNRRDTAGRALEGRGREAGGERRGTIVRRRPQREMQENEDAMQE